MAMFCLDKVGIYHMGPVQVELPLGLHWICCPPFAVTPNMPHRALISLDIYPTYLGTW